MHDPSTRPLARAPSAKRLYPAIEPYQKGHLRVSDEHELYFEISGNKAAPTVVFLHGGPGGCTVPSHRRFFDPNAYRIVLFDQRGCGKSKPFACVYDNTTQALVADLERLREHVGADRWGVFGGSWGSTLALAYGQTHPDRTRFLVLRGIFLARQLELDWLYERRGAALLFPHEFRRYVAGLPAGLRSADSLIQAYHSVLTGPSGPAQSVAASSFARWEAALSYFPGPPIQRARGPPPQADRTSAGALAIARLESHYFVNGAFFNEDGALLRKERMDRIRDIPAAIVNGRFDFVCPVQSAYDLANAWPEASLDIVDNAGHSAFENGTLETLVRITDDFRKFADT